MSSDLATFTVALEKAVSPDTNDTQRAIDILTQLKQTEVTAESLKETKVGLLINRLRKHENTQIQELSKK